jgi:hypothetical protein
MGALISLLAGVVVLGVSAGFSILTAQDIHKQKYGSAKGWSIGAATLNFLAIILMIIILVLIPL